MSGAFKRDGRVDQRCGFIKSSRLSEVIVDTTVQEKDISFPTDSKLMNKVVREGLVNLCKERGIRLRQSYKFKGKREAIRSSRYFHAKQYKRGRASLRKQRNYLGCVIRDIERKFCEDERDDKLKEMLVLARRIYEQKRGDKGKLYSLHEFHVECISKGKARCFYEFGNKVSFTITLRDNWLIGAKSFFGNPFDGRTLGEAVSQTEDITGCEVKRICVDRGYRGKRHHPLGKEVFIAGRVRRGSPPWLKKLLKRRSAIEPVIGHLKREYGLGRNLLKGVLGDQMNPLLAASAFNIQKSMRLILFRFFVCLLTEVKKSWKKNLFCKLSELLKPSSAPTM